MNKAAFDFERLLTESARIHGHICPGQVLGVRMATYGLEKVSIYDPRGGDRKKLYLFVEIDRCATDALQSVTGCSLGRRTMRFTDYGKMAATFVNLETGKAVRLITKEAARKKAQEYFPEIKNKYTCQLKAYKVMPDDELFHHETVAVHIEPHDMPERPISRVQCEQCNEYVQDNREVIKHGRTLCNPCAHGGYYQVENSFACK